MRRHALLLSLLLATGCDKSKPAPDAPVTTAPIASTSAAATSSPSTSPSPSAEPTAAMPSDDTLRRLASGSNAFGFDLWSRVGKSAHGNFAISPASISIAFAMTYGGARGETAAQMKKTLHFDEEPAALAKSWGDLSRGLTAPGRPVTLRIANRLFGERSYAFEAPFLDRTREAFGAPLDQLDFKTAADPARQTINAWIAKQTEDHIRDLLPPGATDALTRLVLVNAIYFLGTWAQPFDTSRTRAATFFTAPSAKKDVPTMTQAKYFGYADVGDVKVLEMPYKGDTTSFVAVLPAKVDGLAAVEARLSPATFDGWRRALHIENVLVSLPRFEVRAAEPLALRPHLAAMGMPLAFDKDKADFGAMAAPTDARERLSISNAFHEAFVQVDENGTEAAAATAVVMAARGGAPSKPAEFKADHPFLFFVVDRASGLVLFAGRVTDPA